MNKSRIMVVGCGTMGGGIAQVAATAGCLVSMCDASPEFAGKGKDRIAASLQRRVEKGALEAAVREEVLSRLTVVPDMSAAAGQYAVIEAVREHLETKQGIFAQLEEYAAPDALLLSNTSMISITSLAQGLKHPERVAGSHFFNPVPRMELVEVIAGEKTSPETVERVSTLIRGWDKTVVNAPDTPGFIVNRTIALMINEAAILAQEGTPYEEIDTAVKLGCNFPMGPLELMDLVGIDVSLDCIVALWEQFERNPKYEPANLLREMVTQGHLGRKSGRGFYTYEQ